MQVLTDRKADHGRVSPSLAFGEVTIDLASRRVRTPSGCGDLEPPVLELLLTLVERPGLTASRDHLIETVWGRGRGSDGALIRAVAKLQHALGDDVRAPRFIEAVPGIGYRWIFEEPPGRRPPPPRWSLGPAWVAAGAMLAMAVGAAGSLGAYAWAQGGEAGKPEPRKVRAQRAESRCPGQPIQDGRAAVRQASPSCPPAAEPRSFAER